MQKKFELELAGILLNIMDNLDVNQIDFSLTDLQNILNKFRVKYDMNQVKNIMKSNWKLTQQKNSNQYQKITVTPDLDFYLNKSKGRYFSVTRKFLTENFDELMTNDN